MSKLTKAVKDGWADEIRDDLLEALAEYHVKQWTNIINEGWLSAGNKDFAYYVGVNDDSLCAEVYESEEAFESEAAPLTAFKIELKITAC